MTDSKIADVTPINKLDCFIGKTFVSIEGMTPGSEEITFTCSDGSVYKMDHYQDCCEYCWLPHYQDCCEYCWLPHYQDCCEYCWLPHYPREYEPESQTWTFYKFRTLKGYVDLRWFGESNGFYSESVNVELINNPTPLLPHEK